jgi:hypothetical protein
VKNIMGPRNGNINILMSEDSYCHMCEFKLESTDPSQTEGTKNRKINNSY